MTIDPKNLGNLTCGLVADPEVIDTRNNNKIVKMRVAADYAGSKEGKADTGYFDVVFFASSDQQSGFVLRQVNEGKMKKGSQLQIAYRLNHEQYKDKEGQNRSKVSLVAEGITYAGGGRPATSEAEAAGPGSAAGASADRRAEPGFEAPDRW